jgi:hypothetical protein
MKSLRVVMWLALASHAGRMRHMLLMILAVAVAVGAWWTLSAMTSPFATTAPAGQTQAIRISSRIGALAQPLPVRYAARIAAVQGVRGVYYSDLDTFPCNAEGYTVTINAWGGLGTAAALQALGFSTTQIHAFQQDPLAILTNAATAERCHWKVGTGIAPPSVFTGHSMELHVRGIGGHDDTGVAVAHYEYINRIGGVTQPHTVAAFFAQARDPRDNNAVAARIEMLFAHDYPPVEANPNTVSQNALARFGSVQHLLAFVMVGAFACCALVLASVFAHAALQRRPQMAVMQVLGFPRRVHWAAQALEVAFVLALGTTLGYALGRAAIHLVQRKLGDTFQNIAAPPWTAEWLWPALLLLAVFALAGPALIALRTRPLDCQQG